MTGPEPKEFENPVRFDPGIPGLYKTWIEEIGMWIELYWVKRTVINLFWLHFPNH